MLIFCNYNFCKDGNALDPSPAVADNFTNTRLTNGIFDYWYVTHDVSSPQGFEPPTVWDYLTVMQANFDGNIEAGNISEALDSISGFRIKRRKVGEFDWINLVYIPIENTTDLSFVFEDNLAQSGVEYEYAFFPVVGDVEGSYVSNTIKTKFDGVFICDLDTIYKFYSEVTYGSNQRVQKVGVFEPYGRKYPVVVSNGAINYETGSVSGNVLPNDYGKTRQLDTLNMVNKRKELLNFLTNKKAKVLKDWNGNIWLMIITGNPSVNFLDGSSMGIANVTASWTEVGDVNNQKDLHNCGIIKEG